MLRLTAPCKPHWGENTLDIGRRKTSCIHTVQPRTIYNNNIINSQSGMYAPKLHHFVCIFVGSGGLLFVGFYGLYLSHLEKGKRRRERNSKMIGQQMFRFSSRPSRQARRSVAATERKCEHTRHSVPFCSRICPLVLTLRDQLLKRSVFQRRPRM